MRRVLLVFLAVLGCSSGGDREVVNETPSYEPTLVAARLSRLLWNVDPPADLLMKAGAARLNRQAVEVLATSMMEDARFRQGLDAFHTSWLELDREIVKDPTTLPEFTRAMGLAMSAATLKLATETTFEGGSLAAVLTTPKVYVNDVLAPLYGIGGVTSSELMRAQVDSNQRIGLLGDVGSLAKHSASGRTWPSKRGGFVLAKLFCLSAPPHDVEVPIESGRRTRDQMIDMTKDGGCQPCHGPLDQLGFPFENFDSLGRWRTEDAGLPVDASAIAPFDNQIVTGEPALARYLATSKRVLSCYASQWSSRVFDEPLQSLDKPGDPARIRDTFVSSGGDVRTLIRTLVTSPRFLDPLIAR
jgi:hypothetical protein